jgi:hypothetical protein
MERNAAVRCGAGLVLAVFFFSIPVFAGPSSLPQEAGEVCLDCHNDAELTSSRGTSVFVDPDAFSGSVHGRAGIGCVGCHADLEGLEDFPHAPGLQAVTCARCHGDYGRISLAGVHGTLSPQLIERPVLCKDCHGYHGVFPSADLRSPVHPSNRPATCAKCHPGAGGYFAKGRVHDLGADTGRSPAGIAKLVYKVIIGLMTAFFLAYISADLLRWRRER